LGRGRRALVHNIPLDFSFLCGSLPFPDIYIYIYIYIDQFQGINISRNGWKVLKLNIKLLNNEILYAMAIGIHLIFVPT
jgi:hypothetical protein